MNPALIDIFVFGKQHGRLWGLVRAMAIPPGLNLDGILTYDVYRFGVFCASKMQPIPGKKFSPCWIISGFEKCAKKLALNSFTYFRTPRTSIRSRSSSQSWRPISSGIGEYTWIWRIEPINHLRYIFVFALIGLEVGKKASGGILDMLE